MFDNMIICIVGLSINMIIGATVWTLMDNEEGTLRAWFDSCPKWCAWFMKPLILHSWFVWLVHYLKSVLSGCNK